MEAETSSCPSILYQNSTQTVTLVDIPTSIAAAQLPSESPKPLEELQCLPRLLSCPPLQLPFPSLEPKSKKAKTNVLARQGAQVDDTRFKELIYRGLEEIRRDYSGEWCLPRSIVPGGSSRKRKRKADNGGAVLGEESKAEPDLCALSHGNTVESTASETCKLATTAPLILKDSNVTVVLKPQAVTSLVCNPALEPHSISLPTDPPSTYIIPSDSAFCLSYINHFTASAFSNSLVDLMENQAAQVCIPFTSRFDLIILDPPWHNKSVTRSRHYSTQRDDPLSCLRPMLGAHIAKNGIVACWVTNKASARADVLECFRVWGVRLIEEWVWLKVTIKGEPVYDVEGLWKKAFEILLVGRKNYGEASETYNSGDRGNGGEPDTKRRLIVGVPDLHSRKPSLRILMEPIIAEGMKYRALEIFARNLTTGWMAWGDEVLKFNWENCWAEAHTDPRQSV